MHMYLGAKSRCNRCSGKITLQMKIPTLHQSIKRYNRIKTPREQVKISCTHYAQLFKIYININLVPRVNASGARIDNEHKVQMKMKIPNHSRSAPSQNDKELHAHLQPRTETHLPLGYRGQRLIIPHSQSPPTADHSREPRASTLLSE